LGLLETIKTAAFTFFPGSQRRDAARSDVPEFSGWAPGNRFAGASRDYGFDTILGRSRDLDENNGWINAGLDRRVESVIGVNIRLSAQPKYQLLNRDYTWRMKWTGDVQPRFDVWGNDIEHRNDARQRLTFGAQARLAYLGYVRDGEACAEIRDDARGIANTTNVLLIEPERVVTPPMLKGSEGPLLRDGIAFDKNGAMTGAWVCSRHPGDYGAREPERYDFIPVRGKTGRAKFVHVFNPRRVEQNRGISRLAEIMVPAKMIDRVDRAEVNAALKSALFSIFIESAGTPEDIGDMLAPASDDALDPWLDAYVNFRGEKPVVVDGAQVNQLFPGEKVHTPTATHPNSNYPDFIRFVLQKIAGSLGISYPQLSQDWSGINYSSARALLNELWRSFMEDRRFFTQAFLTPIYAAWLEVEVANGDVKIPGGPANFYRNKTAICMAEWIGPGRGSVDPLKEANADNLDTAAGRKSTVEAVLERGRDPEDVLAEERYYRQRRIDSGLDPVNHNLKAATTATEQQAAEDTATDDAENGGAPSAPARTREQVPA
jgi:lambda family phage portal protein